MHCDIFYLSEDILPLLQSYFLIVKLMDADY